ncbi:DUF3533 domain-containing protein [Jatrophihabitans sp. YIM 134969]
MSETSTGTGRHEAPEEPRGFGEDLRDALAPRTVALVVAVLLLQIGFVLSYVGAFHAPTPSDVPVRIVGPAAATRPFVTAVEGTDGHPLTATATTDRAAAEAALRDGSTSAVLVVDPSGTKDTLLVASGGGASVATAVETVVQAAEQQQGRTVTVDDVVPLQDGDARGLTGFYLVVGWLVGGYLMAAIIGVAKGARPLTPRRAGFRLGAVLPYAVASGIGGAVVVGPVLHALDAPFLAVAGVGALLVAAAATVTMAFQTLLGVIGIGVTVLVFVVLGNPSAGGAYQSSLLPPFWRAIGPVLPNGAGVDVVRRIAYFGGAGVTSPLLVIVTWLVAGAAVTAAAVVVRQKRKPPATAMP